MGVARLAMPLGFVAVTGIRVPRRIDRDVSLAGSWRGRETPAGWLADRGWVADGAAPGSEEVLIALASVPGSGEERVGCG